MCRDRRGTIGVVLSQKLNDAAATALGVLDGKLDLLPPGGLAVGLRQLAARSIVRRQVLMFRGFSGNPDGAPAIFRDLTVASFGRTNGAGVLSLRRTRAGQFGAEIAALATGNLVARCQASRCDWDPRVDQSALRTRIVGLRPSPVASPTL
jgi:hypothetical protein